MTLHTLFRSLFDGRKPLARRGQAGRRTALGVEQFEDRTVPAAFVDNVVGSVVAVERDPIGLVGSVAAIDPAFPGLVGLAVQDPFSSGHLEKVGIAAPEDYPLGQVGITTPEHYPVGQVGIVGPSDLPVEKLGIVGPTD